MIANSETLTTTQIAERARVTRAGLYLMTQAGNFPPPLPRPANMPRSVPDRWPAAVALRAIELIEQRREAMRLLREMARTPAALEPA